MSEKTGRALIIEDDASWQAILAEILADHGLVVDLASNVEGAISNLRTQPHRLAVVDLSLGGADHHNQDGLLVLDAIKRHDPACIPILLTGFATVELAVSALKEHGAYTCLRKETFRRSEFRRLIQEALASAPVAISSTMQRSPDVAVAPQPPPARPGKHATVLVVEDDAGWRSILAELLTDSGYRVRLASSYGEALGLLRRQRFALAIVDLALASPSGPAGNSDGYRVLANTRAAAIPTIVVSGTAAPSDIERAYAEFSILACIEKRSFDRQALRTTVVEIMSPHHGADSDLAILTTREHDVLTLLTQGMTNKQIADTLVISTNTVKRHLKSIFAKLGVSTRAAATAKALEHSSSLS